MTGRWLFLARAACVGVALLALVIWGVSVPFRYAQLGTVCTAPPCGDQQLTPATLAAWNATGMTLGFFASYTGTLEVLFTLLFLLTGAVIFYRKSDTAIGLVTSTCLVTFGVSQTSPDALAAAIPAFSIPVNLLQPLSFVFLALFVYLFPDGRFAPRWARFPLLAWLVLFIASLAFLPGDLLALLSFAFLLLSLSIQVYRYRWVSTSAQREQTRWVVFGIIAGIVGSVGIIALATILQSPSQRVGGWAFLVGDTLVYLFSALVPISIGVAIARSRLWGIDALINRTLVYATLTVVLALIYWGSVVGLQEVLRPLVGQGNDLAVVASTLLIAALFLPLRRAIQAFIDRQFYRRKYDAARTLEAFSATLRDVVDLPTLADHLVAVVQETMQPAQVSLWLREEMRSEKGGNR